jgi:hypothetical protein
VNVASHFHRVLRENIQNTVKGRLWLFNRCVIIANGGLTECKVPCKANQEGVDGNESTNNSQK